MGFQLALRSVD